MMTKLNAFHAKTEMTRCATMIAEFVRTDNAEKVAEWTERYECWRILWDILSNN